jgi:hypothetical protein
MDIEVIWVGSEPEYFCEGGLDDPNQIEIKGDFSIVALSVWIAIGLKAIGNQRCPLPPPQVILQPGEHRAFSMLAYVWRRTRDAETGAAIESVTEITVSHLRGAVQCTQLTWLESGLSLGALSS